MSFYIGQKVVCVGAPRLSNQNCVGSIITKIGNIFTIREIDPSYIPWHGMVGLRFFEVAGDIVQYMGRPFEPALLAHGFRPIVEKKTDISTLVALLNPINHKKLEDA